MNLMGAPGQAPGRQMPSLVITEFRGWRAGLNGSWNEGQAIPGKKFTPVRLAWNAGFPCRPQADRRVERPSILCGRKQLLGK